MADKRRFEALWPVPRRILRAGNGIIRLEVSWESQEAGSMEEASELGADKTGCGTHSVVRVLAPVPSMFPDTQKNGHASEWEVVAIFACEGGLRVARLL